MSKLKHTYVALDNATIVARRHQREVDPPGMVDIINFIPARSDASLTLRPDLWYTKETIYAISSVISLPESNTLRDALNAATGLYGSEQVTFFTTFVPYGNDNGTSRVLSGTHSDGAVSGAAGQSEVSGVGTKFLEKAYRGAIMRVDPVGTNFTAGAYRFEDSGSGTDEYYLEKIGGASPAIIGVPYIFSSANSSGQSNYQQGTLGSLDVGEFAVGDNDTLGYNCLYIRQPDANPGSYSGATGVWADLRYGIDISGAVNEWASSGSGTNEYYLQTRGGGAPTNFYISEIIGGTYFEKSRPYTIRLVEPTVATSTEGTLGSLNNLEFGLGDNDSLSYTTLYVRDNTANPSGRKIPSTSKGIFNASCYYDLDSGNGFKWNVSSVSSQIFYLTTTGGADPGLDAPSIMWYDYGSGKNAMSQASLAFDRRWRYGDPYDSLGYDTIYVRWNDGDPDVAVPAVTLSAQYSDVKVSTSLYKWTESGSGTKEFYLEAAAGGTPSLSEPRAVWVSGSPLPKGTLGSLADGQWGWGDNDTLGYSTVYVRVNDEDPDDAELQVVAEYKYTTYATDVKWVASATANEYYIISSDDTELAPADPGGIAVNGVDYTGAAIGFLASNEWGYGKLPADGLSNDTIYIYSTTDPNGTASDGKTDSTPPDKVTATSTTNYEYYLVDRVASDTDLVVYGELDSALGNSDVQFYYNHNPFNADYKLNIQAFTSGLIYNAPTIRDNLNEDDINGPFYADLQAGDWAYDGNVVVHDEFVGIGVYFEQQPSLAYNGASYVQIFSTVDKKNETDLPDAAFLGLSYRISEEGSFEKKTISDLTLSGDGDDVRFNSIQSYGSKYLCAAQCINSGTSQYPGIAYSTDTVGLEWTLADDQSFGAWDVADPATRAATDYQCICAAANNSSLSRIVALFWRPNDDRVHVRYSDDLGASWSDCPIGGGNPYFTGSWQSKVKYIGSQFIVTNDTQILYGDGATLTAQAITGATAIRDIAYNNLDTYCIIEESFKVWYASSITGTWTSASLPLDFTGISDSTNHIAWDSVGERFFSASATASFWSDDGITWSSDYFSSYGDTGSIKLPSNPLSTSTNLSFCLYDGGADYLRYVVATRFAFSYWDVTAFVPLDADYRACTFSVLDGYVVLAGTREWDSDTEEWTYYPRRIRWTVPATYNNFEDTGSGTADLNGEGAILDSRPVNGRIVLFETNRVGAVVPRGDTTDPWDYDVIKEDYRPLSNPVTVDDWCYNIATDGLLYMTNGIQLEESKSSFDATKFDDFDETKPIMLDFSRSLNSLIAYYFDPSATNHYAYFISLSNGVVTKIELPEITDSGVSDSIAVEPRFITAVGDSSDQRVIASHHPLASDTDAIVSYTLVAGTKGIEGVDKPLPNNPPQSSYWYSTIESGEIYLVPEGNKTSLKHIIVRTYTDSTVGDNTGRPRLVVMVKSIEDDDWHVSGQDDYSSYNLTGGTCTQSPADTSGVFTNLMHVGAGGGGGSLDVEVPGGRADLFEFYTKTGSTYTKQVLGTDYTVADNGADGYKAVFVSAPASGTDIYAYSGNYPELKVETGDFYESTEGLHRVTGTTGSQNDSGGLTLDHYRSTSNETIDTHYPSVHLPAGDGEVKVGINKLVEGVRIKILVVPEYGSADASTTAKVTGITFGHIPQGRKILKATGS